MSHINETRVLDFYIEQIHSDTIEFLKSRQAFKDSIKEQITSLGNETNMHIKIQMARSLWKTLFEAAMSYIDPDKGGYDRLFKYFDQYVDFEELIFASDSFYRDHTLHCLWVYFLGEYIARSEEFNIITGNSQNDLTRNKHIMEELKKLNDDGMLDKSISNNEDGLKYLRMKDAIRCITALTHDLGYPLKKIYRINKCIKDILPYYDIENYDEFNFHYSSTQQSFIDSFIEFLSWEVILSTSLEYEDNDIEDRFTFADKNRNISGINWEALKEATPEEKLRLKRTFIMVPKIIKNTSKRFRYANDFEKYQHGIMSAFLLMKNISAFRKTNVIYYDGLNMPDYLNNVPEIRTKKNILSAIADHTSEGFQIASLIYDSSFLTFVDELEEFSRISRANQNRQYVNEFCKTDIYMEDEWFNIDFVFNSTEIDNLDPEIAFKGRCKKCLMLFRISELDPNLKIRIRCIGQLAYDKNTYTLEIARKYANITVNGVEQEIPKYLKTNQFYTKQEYMKM